MEQVDPKTRARQMIRDAVKRISPQEREAFASKVALTGANLFTVLKALRGECAECGTGTLNGRRCTSCGYVLPFER